VRAPLHVPGARTNVGPPEPPGATDVPMRTRVGAFLVLVLTAGGCGSATDQGLPGSGGTTSSGGGGANAGGSGGGGSPMTGGAGGSTTGGDGGSNASGPDASGAGDTGGAGEDGGGGAGGIEGGGGAADPHPMLAVLPQFTAPDVPARGPAEAAPISRGWTAPGTLPTWPGNGIAQHPMLYVGEGYNTLFLVNEGKVIWTYAAGSGGEIDDVWMLSNGHVLFAFQHHVIELTPKKEVVWQYDPPTGTEVHSCQPIGRDKVLMMQNGLPAKILVINKTTKAVEVDHDLTDAGTNVHPQFRRVRMTGAGTYLAPYLKGNKVVEFDKDFNIIWTYPILNPWAAVRLLNGNTLITDEHDRISREVNPKGETVWEFTQALLPPGAVQHNTQTSDRLSSGNTVIFSSTGGAKPPMIQAIEITPDKKVAWVLEDWKDLGPATTAQFLDDPGIPENPGELQH
jgi:hypothetical protein